jgi:D-alanyl-D-alanine carboxypeptidase/D-alanyl-D-alanine-endopeptidase (penicillin-binding protein 4)
MGRWFQIIIFWVILLLCSSLQARIKFRSEPIYGIQNLTAEINRIIYNTDPNATVGIHIKSMKYGDTLYAKNEQRLLVPASIVKIFTAEAALLYLGPEFKFPTRFFTDAQATNTNNGVLNGNVYIVHSGDPSLTYNDISEMMSSLKSQQIQRINGNVYIDNSAYDQNNFGPGWEQDDTRFCYAAPINASIINRNCLSFKIAPAKRPGYLANIIRNPNFYTGNIYNSVTTKKHRARACYIRVNKDANNTISLSGCVPKGHYAQGVSTVISNVVQYNRSLLHSLFERFGILVGGDIVSGVAPYHSSLLASHESKPLPVLIKEMLKKSDNIIAGSLFKKIGELYTEQPGSWKNGSLAVKAILAKKAAIDTSQMNIMDGSGISPENRIKPIQMMQVLEFAYHHTPTNSAFVSALPLAGVDGTLKRRLYNVSRKVRAKTGTLAERGVVSLAGYTITKDKEPVGFVIIVNGRRGYDWKYRAMEDKIVTALANYQRQ